MGLLGSFILQGTKGMETETQMRLTRGKRHFIPATCGAVPWGEEPGDALGTDLSDMLRTAWRPRLCFVMHK